MEGTVILLLKIKNHFFGKSLLEMLNLTPDHLFGNVV